jgi:type I restriction enzyme S subunit
MRFVQLSDVCDLQNGFAFKSTDYVEKSNTCNIRMSNIRPGGSFNEFHNERYLPDSYAKEYKEYLLNDGDLIIAMTDMATETKILGLPTLVNNTTGRNFLLNQRVGKLCKFSEDIYVPYLRYILTAQDVIDYYKSKGAGGLQINISKKDILSVKFPLPSIPTQQNIVAKLDAIFSKIDTALGVAEVNAKNAEALFQNYLDEIFNAEKEDFIALPIGEIGEIISGSGFPLNEQGLLNEEIPFYKVSDMNLIGNEKYMITHNNSISKQTAKQLGAKIIPPKSVIFPKIGGAIATNKKRILSVPSFVDNNVMGIFPNEKVVSPEFFFYLFSSIQLSSFANEAALPSIKKSTVEERIVKIPKSLSEQEKLVTRIELLKHNSSSLYSGYLRKVDNLILLKNSITKQAFSGELVRD